MSLPLKNYVAVFGIALCMLTAFACYSRIEHHAKLDAYDGGSTDSGVANAIYQQDVDHFSDDARAMSPRSWGSIDPGNGEPQAPAVSFGTPATRPVRRPATNPDSRRFLQAESRTIKEPKEYYETEPLNEPLNKNHGGTPSSSTSSPLPGISATPANQDVDDFENNIGSPSTVSPQPSLTIVPENRLNGIASPDQGVQDTPSLPIQSMPYQAGPNPSLSDMTDVCQCHINQRPNNCPQCGLPELQDPNLHNHSDCRCDKCQSRRRLKCGSGKCQHSQCPSECQACSTCDTCGHGECLEPKYNPALGHRQSYPITQQFYGSSGETFPFEEGDEYPPLREILSQSTYFAEADFMFLQPSFQANTAVSIAGSGFGISQPFNFDLLPAFRVAGGLQTEFGPGVAVEYFQFDNNSRVNTFSSDGVATGTTQLYQLGPNTWTSLVADDPGETINALHSVEVHSTNIHAFKAINFKRSSVNGRFGLQYVTLEQKLESELFDAGGMSMGRLTGTSDLTAFGPRFGVDYVRKIGHTPLQIVSSATSAVLFGDRDQTVNNTSTGEISRIGADEFLTIIDIFLGVQSKSYRGENRNISTRIGFVNQTWLGGGTAIDPSGDFGFQGFSIMVGLNR